MRLPEKIRYKLMQAIRESFGPVPVILYGSRVDDAKLGGDIDIALQTDIPSSEFEKKRIQLLTTLTLADFELPLDLVQYHSAMNPLLKAEIDSEGFLLSTTEP
jgi:hypothetical protein